MIILTACYPLYTQRESFYRYIEMSSAKVWHLSLEIICLKNQIHVMIRFFSPLEMSFEKREREQKLTSKSKTVNKC